MRRIKSGIDKESKNLTKSELWPKTKIYNTALSNQLQQICWRGSHRRE